MKKLIVLFILAIAWPAFAQYDFVRVGEAKAGKNRIGRQKKIVTITFSKADTFYIYNTDTLFLKWRVRAKRFKVNYGYTFYALTNTIETDRQFVKIPVVPTSKLFVEVESPRYSSKRNLICVLPYAPNRDLDRDGKVTVKDFQLLNFYYGGRLYYRNGEIVPVNYWREADYYNDGVIDDLDIRIFMEYYEIRL